MTSDVDKLRGQAGDPNSFDALAKVALDLVGPGNAAWRLVVAFPEWPRLPWLAIPSGERARRLRLLFTDHYPTLAPASAKDILPARLPKDLVTRLEAAIAEYGLPIIPIGSGCWSIAETDLMKLQGKNIDWSRLELAPGETTQSFLAVSVLHWQRSDSDLSASFSNLLKLIRPANIPQDKLPKWKGTAEGQSMYDLKALGAYYLLKRMSWQQAVQLTETRLGLGNPLFSEQSAWIKARKRAEELWGNF
jgi:hypothetical protein